MRSIASSPGLEVGKNLVRDLLDQLGDSEAAANRLKVDAREQAEISEGTVYQADQMRKVEFQSGKEWAYADVREMVEAKARRGGLL